MDNHDFDTARGGLADDVRVTATTTKPVMPATDLAGIDPYMEGLVEFAQAVVPGSLGEVASLRRRRPAAVVPPGRLLCRSSGHGGAALS
jgi:hypothetical protein